MTEAHASAVTDPSTTTAPNSGAATDVCTKPNRPAATHSPVRAIAVVGLSTTVIPVASATRVAISTRTHAPDKAA